MIGAIGRVLADFLGAGQYQGRIEGLHLDPPLALTLASLNVVNGACYVVLFWVWAFAPDVAFRARVRLIKPFIAATIIQAAVQACDFTTLFTGVYYLKALVQAALAGVLIVIAAQMILGALEQRAARK